MSRSICCHGWDLIAAASAWIRCCMPAEALIWVVPLALVGGVLLGVASLAWLQRRQGRGLEQAEQRLRGSFAELANAALRHNTDQFLQLAGERFAREQSGV